MSENSSDNRSPDSRDSAVKRGAGKRGPTPDREISLLQLINILLRHRWKVLGLPILAILVAVVIPLSDPPTYTSNASFTTQFDLDGGRRLSGLSNVASQFGINVPSGGAQQSPQFYSDLLTSRPILDDVARAEYSVIRDGETVSGSLLELYPINSLEGASGWLKARISARIKTETGVIEVFVTTESPKLSKQLSDRLLELVDRFNLEVRQSQASARADFIAQRMENARRELRTVEDSLETFLERNRSFQNSPTLRFEHQRLQRRVDLKQQVYTSLATRYEQAQISKVADTPVITVISPPTFPSAPDPRSIYLRGAVGLVLGGILSLLWVVGVEFVRSAREQEQDQFRELRSIRGDISREFLYLKRKLRQLF